jgi:hypothetical protein
MTYYEIEEIPTECEFCASPPTKMVRIKKGVYRSYHWVCKNHQYKPKEVFDWRASA